VIHETRKRHTSTINRAIQLRQAGNMAEAILWNELKGRELAGAKSVRQMPIGPGRSKEKVKERSDPWTCGSTPPIRVP
jgi:very-short-patch-repair endonuclease